MGTLSKDETIITEVEVRAQSLAKSVEHKEATIAGLNSGLRGSREFQGKVPGTPEPEHSQSLRDLTNTRQEKLQEVKKEL